MDTSGNGLANSALYAVMLWSAVLAALRMRSLRPRRAPFPVAALTLWLLVAVPSLLQLAFPSIYRALHRAPDLITQHGQWWRLLTAVLVQDGGVGGTAFNLAALAVVAVVAERLWGPRPTPAIFAACALAMNVLGVWWNAEGGGNSGATFGLAMSMAGLALLRGDGRVRVLALPACGAAVVLVAIGDGHGVVALFGAALGVAVGMAPGTAAGMSAPVTALPAHDDRQQA
ncbi:rhomboid family intramembrane serine protease [Streptomyces sp. NPDC059373]